MKVSTITLTTEDLSTLALALIEWKAVLRNSLKRSSITSDQFAFEMQNASRMLRLLQDAGNRLSEPVTLKVDNGTIGQSTDF